MKIKRLILTLLISAAMAKCSMAETGNAETLYPNVHTMMTTGNLIVGSTLDVADQTLRIAENSKPEKGFLVLESLRHVDGRNAYKGFIQQGPDVTLTVLQHNDGSMTKIYQSDKGVEIKQVDGVRKEPLKPDVAEVARASGTSMDWVSNSSGRAVNSNQELPANLGPYPEPDGPNFVDSLILFDPRLPARVNMVGRQFETDLSGAINLTQTIFENSELSLGHRLAGTHAINLPSTTDRYINSPTEDILEELVTSGEVQRLKDIYDADVVHYIGLTDEVCGQAYVASEIDLNNEFNSTSLDFHAAYTNYGCLGNGTFAHELGHNLGLYHDRYTLANNEDGAGDSFDNHIPYGYIEPEGAFYTTMAYQSSCTDVFTHGECATAPIYSNPDVVLEGSPAGASEVVVDSANASGALRLTLPWAVNYQSQADLTAASLIPRETSAQLAWLANSDAQYILLNQTCNESQFLSASQIARAEVLSGSQAETSLIDTTQIRVCILESLNPDDSSYRIWAEYQANIDQSGSSPQYLLVQENSLLIKNPSETPSISFVVSDETIVNSEIALALYTDSNGGRPILADGINTANQWFDISISGSGTERTATLNFIKSPSEIASELASNDQRNPFNLPLALVDTRFNEYRVSSVFWISDYPAHGYKGLPYGFFEDGEFLLNEQPYEISALLNNVPADASVSVTQAGDITLPNFSYTVSDGDTASQRVIEVTGDPVTIETQGVWQLVANWGPRADQQVTLGLTGYAEDGNRVQGVRFLSDLVEGEDILLEVTLADLEDNSFWDTLEVRRLVPGQEDVVYDTPESQDGNVFVFNLGQLPADDYELQLALDYVDGGQVVYSLDVTVNEGNGGGDGGGNDNQAPTVSLSGPSGNVEVDESFTVTASGSDPDGDSLTYAWEQTGGSGLTLSGVDSESLTVTATAEGSYTVQVTVTDTSGASATASFDFTAEVTPVAPPPVPEPDNGGSSGGSTGWLVILLGLIGSVRLRRT